MNKAKEHMTFVTPAPVNHERRTDGRELLRAGDMFNEELDNILLAHAPDVAVYSSYQHGSQVEKASLFKKIDGEDGSWVRVSVFSTWIPSADRHEKRVMLQEIDVDGKDRAMHVYNCGGKIVYRQDTKDVYGDIQKERAFNADATDISMAALMSQMQKEAHEQEQNEALEYQMGLNHQPVGPQEVEKLMTLVAKADVYDGSRVRDHE